MASRYSNIEVVKNSNGKRYYINNIYPDIPVSDSDIYIIPTLGDRLDTISYNFYKDSSLYWILISANNLSGDSLIPPLGQQLRVPINVEEVINMYTEVNTNR